MPKINFDEVEHSDQPGDFTSSSSRSRSRSHSTESNNLPGVPEGSLCLELNDRGDYLVVGFSTFKGRRSLHVRLWYTDQFSMTLKPTQKGVAIPEELAGDALDLITAVVRSNE
jgi:hypothetical protein